MEQKTISKHGCSQQVQPSTTLVSSYHHIQKRVSSYHRKFVITARITVRGQYIPPHQNIQTIKQFLSPSYTKCTSSLSSSSSSPSPKCEPQLHKQLQNILPRYLGIWMPLHFFNIRLCVTTEFVVDMVSYISLYLGGKLYI